MMRTAKLFLCGLCCLSWAALSGCAAGKTSGCTPTGFLMSVGAATDSNSAPDHTAAPPGNQELFQAGIGSDFGPGCVTPQVEALTRAQWTVSDPINTSISSANDSTNGLATCLGATTGNATVSATLKSGTLTQTMSTPIVCK